MPTPVDFYDDANHQHLYGLDRLYGIPTFVKQAETESTEDLQQLPPHVFADLRHRKFPCHTKAATWLANAYFKLGRDAYSKEDAQQVQGRINKSASYWGITGLVDRFNKTFEKLSNFNEAELPDEKYAIVAESEHGKIRRLPMPNAFAVKMAGEHLFAHRHQYPYPWRKSAARRILKEALAYDKRAEAGEKVAGAAHGITQFDKDTQEYLERTAGFGIAH